MTPSEDVVLMRNEYVPSRLIALKRSNSTKVLSATAPREATIGVSATGALLNVIVFSLQELLRTRRNWPPELDGSVTNSLSLAPVTVLPAVPVTVNLRKIISTGELSAFRPVAVRKLDGGAVTLHDGIGRGRKGQGGGFGGTGNKGNCGGHEEKD